MKKVLSFFMLMLILGMTTDTFAAENEDVYSDVAIQAMGTINPERVKEIPSEDLSGFTLDTFSAPLSESIKGIELNSKQTRGTWWFNDPVGIVNGDLSEAADFYLVENTSDVYAFLKLTADNPNLLALLYYVNGDGTLGDSTGFGVYANQPHVATGLPIGTYAIAIGSADGSARGTYNLHWNRSNPFAQLNESSIPISVSEDLSKVIIKYKVTGKT